ncbi:MAG: 50S ribosomal protein L21 [Acidobacteria bacterium]|nr:50S ribosomal protein L21 [Acidobacteriota bacterium]
MSYAIIRTGGKQFRVAEGETVRVPTLGEKSGATIEFDVLVFGGDNETKVGSPLVDGARVAGTIVGHGRGEKIIVFKKKRRKQYKRTQGRTTDH